MKNFIITPRGYRQFLGFVTGKSSFHKSTWMSQSKYWCWTLNNATEEETKALETAMAAADLSYLVAGNEVGAEGTPHLQGYMEFRRRARLAGCKRVPGLSRAHFEIRRGTALQASEYCKKDGDVLLEHGELTADTPGRRNDILRAREQIAAGEIATIAELWRVHPTLMVRQRGGMEELFRRTRPRRELAGFPLSSFPFRINWNDHGTYVLWGPSGNGKTSYVRSCFPRALMISHLDKLTEFEEGYHTAIIFDDMNFNHMHREAQIYLVDQDDDRDIHVRYTTATIPRRTLKIFTTNIQDGRIFDIDDAAIRRRVKMVHVNMRPYEGEDMEPRVQVDLDISTPPIQERYPYGAP